MLVRHMVLTGLLVLGMSGCGSSSRHPAAAPSHPTASLPSVDPMSAPAPTGKAADPSAVEVIREWSTRLREGDVIRAAGYFAIPGEFFNGGSVIIVRRFAQAVAVKATLPCGARFLSADRRGRYINALFRLTARSGPGGSKCAGGAGATARKNFLISRGRIVAWVRAPDDPGDNQAPPARPPAPQTPARQPDAAPIV
jgi:hypothetical protein